MDKLEYEANGWIARDREVFLRQEPLYFYRRKPYLCKSTGAWNAPVFYWQLPTEWLPDVISERDCIPVKLKLTIEEVGK